MTGYRERNWRKRAFQLLAVFATLTCPAKSSIAAEWGDLKIRFTLEKRESPSKPETEGAASASGIVAVPVVVHKTNRRIRDVVVVLHQTAANQVPVHAEFEKRANERITVTNSGGVFEPHVACLRTGQTLRIQNQNRFEIHPRLEFFTNLPFGRIVKAGESRDVRPTKPERRPTRIVDLIRPKNGGYVVVKDHPYMVVSDANGDLVSKRLPTGKWTFQIWHESAGQLQNVKFDGKKTTGIEAERN